MNIWSDLANSTSAGGKRLQRTTLLLFIVPHAPGFKVQTMASTLCSLLDLMHISLVSSSLTRNLTDMEFWEVTPPLDKLTRSKATTSSYLCRQSYTAVGKWGWWDQWSKSEWRVCLGNHVIHPHPGFPAWGRPALRGAEKLQTEREIVWG